MEKVDTKVIGIQASLSPLESVAEDTIRSSSLLSTTFTKDDKVYSPSIDSLSGIKDYSAGKMIYSKMAPSFTSSTSISNNTLSDNGTDTIGNASGTNTYPLQESINTDITKVTTTTTASTTIPPILLPQPYSLVSTHAISTVIEKELPSDRSLTASQLENILSASQSRWLSSNEVYKLLHSFRRHNLTVHNTPQTTAVSGTLFLYAPGVKVRQDGYIWSRKIDSEGYSVLKEHHVKLLVGGVRVMTCYYSQREDIPTFCRRIYWLLDSEFPNIQPTKGKSNYNTDDTMSTGTTTTSTTLTNNNTTNSNNNAVSAAKRTTSIGGTHPTSIDTVNQFIDTLKKTPLPEDSNEVDNAIRGIVLVHYLNPSPSLTINTKPSSTHTSKSVKTPSSGNNPNTTISSSLSPSQPSSIAPSGRASPGVSGSGLNDNATTDSSISSQRVARRNNKRAITSVTNSLTETNNSINNSENSNVDTVNTDISMVNIASRESDTLQNTSLNTNEEELSSQATVDDSVVSTPTNKLRKYSDIIIDGNGNNSSSSTIMNSTTTGTLVKNDSSKIKRKLSRPTSTVQSANPSVAVSSSSSSSSSSTPTTTVPSSFRVQSSLAPGITEPQRNIPLRRLLPPDSLPNSTVSPSITGKSTTTNRLAPYNDNLFQILLQSSSNTKGNFSLPDNHPLSSSNSLRNAESLSTSDTLNDWNNGKDLFSSIIPSNDDSSFDFMSPNDSLDAFFPGSFSSLSASTLINNDPKSSFVSQVIPGLLDEDQDMNHITTTTEGFVVNIPSSDAKVPLLSTDASTVVSSTSLSDTNYSPVSSSKPMHKRIPLYHEETIPSTATIVSNDYVDIEDEYEEDNDQDDENVPFADVENLENKTDKLLSRVADQLAQLSGVLPQTNNGANGNTNNNGNTANFNAYPNTDPMVSTSRFTPSSSSAKSFTKVRSLSIGGNNGNTFTANNSTVVSHSSLPSLIDPSTGQSLLHLAVLASNYFFTQTLLQMGSDPMTPDQHGQTCLQIATVIQDTKMIELLRRYCGSSAQDTKSITKTKEDFDNYDTNSIQLPFPSSSLGKQHGLLSLSSSSSTKTNHHPFSSSNTIPSAALSLSLVQQPPSSSAYSHRKRGLSTADRHALVESFAALSLREKCAVAKVLDNPIIDDEGTMNNQDYGANDNDGDSNTNRYSDVHTINDDDRNTVSSLSSVATRDYLERRRNNGGMYPTGDNMSINDDTLSLAPPDAASVAHAMYLMSSDELFDLEMEAKVIQSGVRAWLIRRNYLHLRQATRALQGAIRQMIHRRRSRQSQQQEQKRVSKESNSIQGFNVHSPSSLNKEGRSEGTDSSLTTGPTKFSSPSAVPTSQSMVGNGNYDTTIREDHPVAKSNFVTKGTVVTVHSTSSSSTISNPNGGKSTNTPRNNSYDSNHQNPSTIESSPVSSMGNNSNNNNDLPVENTFELERSRRQADAAAVIARSIKRWYGNH